MLTELGLQTLQERRAQTNVMLFYWADNKLVDICIEHHVTPFTASRRGHKLNIPRTRLKSYQWSFNPTNGHSFHKAVGWATNTPCKSGQCGNLQAEPPEDQPSIVKINLQYKTNKKLQYCTVNYCWHWILEIYYQFLSAAMHTVCYYSNRRLI